MNINLGEFNKKIQIIKQIKEEDDDGFCRVIEEKIIRSPWAKFTRTSGTETVKANADFGEIKARFLVRYSPTLIDRKMVVKYNGDIYNIVYVNDYEDGHEYIEIWCDIVGLK